VQFIHRFVNENFIHYALRRTAV